jgi:hypothetical protein
LWDEEIRPPEKESVYKMHGEGLVPERGRRVFLSRDGRQVIQHMRRTHMAARKKATKSGRGTRKAVPASPLVLKRQTVTDLQAMLKQTTRVRQSKKVCVA